MAAEGGRLRPLLFRLLALTCAREPLLRFLELGRQGAAAGWAGVLHRQRPERALDRVRSFPCTHRSGSDAPATGRRTLVLHRQAVLHAGVAPEPALRARLAGWDPPNRRVLHLRGRQADRLCELIAHDAACDQLVRYLVVQEPP